MTQRRARNSSNKLHCLVCYIAWFVFAEHRICSSLLLAIQFCNMTVSLCQEKMPSEMLFMFCASCCDWGIWSPYWATAPFPMNTGSHHADIIVPPSAICAWVCVCVYDSVRGQLVPFCDTFDSTANTDNILITVNEYCPVTGLLDFLLCISH